MDNIDAIESDIKSLKIQGATNVALAVLDALEHHPTKDVGMRLAYARPTEPLAQNAIRYIFTDNPASVSTKISEYKKYIAHAKAKISQYASTLMKDGATYLTHCHASTVTNVFLNAHRDGKKIKVIATETRPLMQGRITVKELLDGGLIDVTMIIDSATASVLSDPARTVSAVIIGADLLSESGFVNKIGSLPIIIAAREHNVPVYCFSTLLKYDPQPFTPERIETRDAAEIWPEAPKDLAISGPAFDFTPYGSGISIVCEEGIIAGSQVKEMVMKHYSFIMK